MRQILSVILVIAMASNYLFTQPTQALLIPYNDHGKWGYCDTLGTVQIEPAFENARFFYSKSIGSGKRLVARVETKWGNNFVQTNGELLLSRKLSFVQQISSEQSPNTFVLVQKKGKYGVYQYDKGLVVRTKYDSTAALYYDVLLKKKNDATYTQFSTRTGELLPTNIVSVDLYLHQYNEVKIATTLDGNKYKVEKDQLILIEPADMANFKAIGELVYEVPDDWVNSGFGWIGPKPTAEELGVDRMTGFRDYSTTGISGKYGFQKLIIAVRGNQMGVVNEKGEEILPFQYGSVNFTGDGSQATLKKNGQVGRKIFFTHHPTIEPRYDKLWKARSLQVTATWSFGVFGIEINGMTGYVGENAVEYFDFD